jgi:hypothetical protein
MWSLQEPLLQSQLRQPGALPLPTPRVGSIYQRFSSLEEGVVQNIIKGGDGWFFNRGNGVTITVTAKFVPSGPKTIKLTFESVGVGGLRVSEAAESFLAPALLPRGSLQQQVLLWFREVRRLQMLPKNAPEMTNNCLYYLFTRSSVICLGVSPKKCDSW